MVKRMINDLGLILLALILAVVVWFVAVQEENPIITGEFQDSIAVEIRNQPDGTTTLPEGFNATIQLLIRAPQTNWQDLRTDNFSAWVDLSGQQVGNYQVPVQVECIDDNVRILEVRPSQVSVHLRQEIERTIPVELRLFGTLPLGYELNTDTDRIQMQPEIVTLTGPELVVNQISRVTVDLDVSNRKETFIGSRRVTARNSDEEPISFVNVEPPSVQITVPIVQQIGSTEVAVRPVVVGTVDAGYWVRSVTVEPAIVTLFGDPEFIREIQGYVETLPLDVTGAAGDVVERMPLDLPEQVSSVGVQGVKVTVRVEARQSSVTILREPVIRGLGADLEATIRPSEVAVSLTGPLPRLSSLDEEDVFVYVDLLEKGIGQHQILLTTLVPEGLTVLSLLPDTVDVEIRRVQPTPTATHTRLPTATPTPTATTTVVEGTTPQAPGTPAPGSTLPAPTATPAPKTKN